MRSWAFGMFAAFALSTSCSDDDDIATGPQEPDVTFKDLIEYDKTPAVKIKSAIYEIDAQQHYTFYLSPSEGITDVEGMKAANDYLAVTLAQPKGTVNTDKDIFELSYKDIKVTKNTLTDIAAIDLSVDLVTESRLNFRVNLEMKSGKKLFSRYENTCVEAQVELNNQFNINREVKEIKSAIYSIVNNQYVFFLSPTAGITDYPAMQKANDYVQIAVEEPNGYVNTHTDFFEVNYTDKISVSNTNRDDVRIMSLKALVKEQKATLALELETKSGNRMTLAYNGDIIREYIMLENQYAFNKEVHEVGSVVEWKNASTGFNHYYIYGAKGITSPSKSEKGVEIKIANTLEGEIDLATADPKEVEVRYGDFVTGQGMSGTLEVKYKTDKFGKVTGLIVKLEANMGDNQVRAGYEGAFTTGFASGNYIKVTDKQAAQGTIVKAFRQEPYNAGHVMAFGDAQSVNTPEDLTKGNYTVKFSVVPNQFGAVINVAEQKNDFSFEMYDYKNYKTYFTEDVVSGSIETKANDFDAKMGYIKLNLTLKGDIKVEAEYYGELTGVKSFPELKPVKPFAPSIVITDEKGQKELYNSNVTRMEVRRDLSNKWHGTTAHPIYVFYFVNEHTHDIDDSNDMTPVLTLPVSAIEAGKEFDLTKAGFHWEFMYASDQLSRAGRGYSDSYTEYGMTSLMCPDMVKVKAVRNADKTWEVEFTLQDFGAFNQWSPDEKSGTKNIITIKWKGAATKYSGYKKNDLTDEDFK